MARPEPTEQWHRKCICAQGGDDSRSPTRYVRATQQEGNTHRGAQLMRSPDEISHAFKHAAVVGVLRPELMIDDQDVFAFHPAAPVATAILAQLRRFDKREHDARQNSSSAPGDADNTPGIASNTSEVESAARADSV